MQLVEQKSVQFEGSELLVARTSNDKIYVAIKWVCLGIGLTDGQYQNQTRKINDDVVLCKGVAKLQLPTPGGTQDVLCIEIDYLPLWLAKINANIIENFIVKEKLVNYQLRAKDVLSNAFLPQAKTPQTELEALAALGNAVSLMANQMIQAQQKVEVLETKVTNIQEAFDPELHDKPWRTWVKTSISRLAKSKGGYADDYQTTYANLYALLEQRAGCRLTERLNNRKERARRLGLPKSGVEKLNHIDVIEADKRLKEIFTSLIREALVAIA